MAGRVKIENKVGAYLGLKLLLHVSDPLSRLLELPLVQDYSRSTARSPSLMLAAAHMLLLFLLFLLLPPLSPSGLGLGRLVVGGA